MTYVLIDRRGHLAQLAVQAGLGLVAFVTLSWIPLATAALIFGVSAIAWPSGAVVLRLWNTVSSGPEWLDDARPPRISTALAAINFAGIAVAVGLEMDTPLMWAGLLVMCSALVVEVIVGACIPCELVVWAARRGWLRFRSPIGDTT